MDPPILDIKKEILLEELGDGNSSISRILPLFVGKEMPVPRDTDLLQNDCTGIALNGLTDISHTSKEDHVFADYPREVQDRDTKMDSDGPRSNIPGLGFETTKLSLPLFSCCSGTNTSNDCHSHASMKTEESNSLPDVLEADVKLEEPSGFSLTKTGQNSYLVSKTTNTVPEFHPGAIDQLDSNQINGNKFPDCVDIKKEVIQLSSSPSQFFRDIDAEQKLSPLLLGTISDKNLVHHENIETSVEKENDKGHNNAIVFRSSKCHTHQSCSMISRQISISKDSSMFARSEKEENDEDVFSPNNHMSCTALASSISDEVASYGNTDDVLSHDNEFSIVIDNAESDDVIKGKGAMGKVKKCQFIFTTQRLKQKGTCCGKKRCSSTPASLTNVRTVKKSLRNAKPKDKDDRNDDDLEAGESTSTLALSEDVGRGLDSNTFEKTRTTAEESTFASVSRETETDLHPHQICKTTFSTQSTFQGHSRLEHNGTGWGIGQKERHLERSLKQNESIGSSVNLEAQPEDQRMNDMQMDDHVVKSIDLNDPETFKHCNYNQSVLSDEHFGLSNEIGPLFKNAFTRSREKLHVFKCGECGKCLSRRQTLQEHMKTHTGEKPFKCDECGKCFSSKQTLQGHMRTHTGEKPFKCNECDKYFSMNYCLQKHIRTHKGKNLFKCDECGKCFTLKASLQQHEQTHTGIKSFKCDVCGKCLGCKVSLEVHMRIHTGEKPYKCGICSKCFSRTQSLRAHMRTHTGERPFKCGICSKCFSQKYGLRVHMRRHTGEKPFRCDECGECFTVNEKLQAHIRKHTGEKPFKCNECGKCFHKSGRLRVHMLKHTGEKPFRCDECGKCFGRSCRLQTHMRTHTGQKPFKCDKCGKRFTARGNLKRHEQTHTAIKCDV